MHDYTPVPEDLITVTKYDVLGELPDPFLMNDGSRVSSAADWEKRRKEIYKTAVELQYGEMPPEPVFLEVRVTSDAWSTFSTYMIKTGTHKNPIWLSMTVLAPKDFDRQKKYPAVVDGDHCFPYHLDPEYRAAFTDNRILLVLFNRTDLAPDNDYAGRVGQIYDTYPNSDISSMCAWAWGYSRCVDALEKLGFVDMRYLTFSGHSRGAKAAMLAGACDTRAAIVNPNSTCAGGCGCYRVHMSAITQDGEEKPSETLDRIVKKFPFWFGEKMPEYAFRENELPFDCHFLKALIAPRVFFQTEAGSDIWANPVGAWQTTMAVKEVYRFLGAEDNLFWHYRDGYHYHKVQDVENLVRLILHKKDGTPLPDTFFKTPFKAPELIFRWRCPEKKD